MIACDKYAQISQPARCARIYANDVALTARRCENWYHLDCVKIDEDRVHLVDQFICPICATSKLGLAEFILTDLTDSMVSCSIGGAYDVESGLSWG